MSISLRTREKDIFGVQKKKSLDTSLTSKLALGSVGVGLITAGAFALGNEKAPAQDPGVAAQSIGHQIVTLAKQAEKPNVSVDTSESSQHVSVTRGATAYDFTVAGTRNRAKALAVDTVSVSETLPSGASETILTMKHEAGTGWTVNGEVANGETANPAIGVASRLLEQLGGGEANSTTPPVMVYPQATR